MSTSRERLLRARRQLTLSVMSSALLWLLASAGLVLLLGSRLIESRLLVVAAAALLGVGVSLVLHWRQRGVRSVESLALWIEEQQPGLEFALVTAADPRFEAAATSALTTRAGAADIEGLTRRAVTSLLTRAGTAALVVATVALALGGTGFANPGEPGSRPPAELPNRLLGLKARITPPPYAHLPSSDGTDPSTIEALVGSRIAISGTRSADGITVSLGPDTRAAQPQGSGWSVDFAMPVLPAAVTLVDRQYRRLIVLAPRSDSAPQVVLSNPLHDTTYQQVPSEPLALEARSTDDLGLATGYFEFLISTGSGENFTTVSRTGPEVKLTGKSATLRGSIALDTLKLTPGSVVSIRAVVLDQNDVTGPGKGISETRTLRLAERLDSTNITAAPPDQIDSMLISQRLLNLRTDTLIRSRKALGKSGVGDRSMTYSNVQETIRQRVLAVIALLEDDGVGGSASTEVSLLLRSAGEEMQSARLDLAVARPDTARPHMRRALAILDQIRTSHRYYLRGQTRPVLVDVSRVRLSGEGTPAPAPRLPREQLRDLESRLAVRIERAAALYSSSPAAALDSLTLVQVSALATHPGVAKQLGEAVASLRKGISADVALSAVRRALAPAVERLSGPPEWGPVSPQ